MNLRVARMDHGFIVVIIAGFSEITPSLMCRATVTPAPGRGLSIGRAGTALEKDVSTVLELPARTVLRPVYFLTGGSVRDVVVTAFGSSRMSIAVIAAQARVGFEKPAENAAGVASFTCARVAESLRTF